MKPTWVAVGRQSGRVVALVVVAHVLVGGLVAAQGLHPEEPEPPLNPMPTPTASPDPDPMETAAPLAENGRRQLGQAIDDAAAPPAAESPRPESAAPPPPTAPSPEPGPPALPPRPPASPAPVAPPNPPAIDDVTEQPAVALVPLPVPGEPWEPAPGPGCGDSLQSAPPRASSDFSVTAPPPGGGTAGADPPSSFLSDAAVPCEAAQGSAPAPAVGFASLVQAPASGSAPWLVWEGLAAFGLAAFLARFLWIEFTRLEPERILVHPNRSAIVAFIQQNAGTDLACLAKSLGMSRSVARKHVAALVRFGRLAVKRIEGRTALFLNGQAPRHQHERLTLLRRPQFERVYRLLVGFPGLDQATIRERLGISQQRASVILRRMQGAEMIRAEPSGSRRVYLPA